MRAHAAALLVLLTVVAGCGDADLWARWRIEKRMYQVRRLASHLPSDPTRAADADLAGTAAAFTAIREDYPPSRWATPEALRRPRARDVATIAGRAAVAAARLEEARGRSTEALAAYDRARLEFAGVLPVRLDASLARAEALERAGNTALATDAYAEIVREFPVVDPETGKPLAAVLDAPIKAARALLERGDQARADAVLGDAEASLLREIPRHRGSTIAPELWVRLAGVRAARGRPDQLDPALDALRHALAERRVGPRAPEVVLMLAQFSFLGGRADSALAYAGWAEQMSYEHARPDALLLEARVYQATARPDSAIALYGRFIDDYSNLSEPAGIARFSRARLLEGLGRWDLARTEYRALIATDPTHPASFQARELLVRHYTQLHEKDLAQDEAQRALDELERMITTNQDVEVQKQARATRARLLIATEEYGPACEALTELWNRYAGDPLGASAALEAAGIAVERLNDRGRARRLYEEVAQRAVDPRAQQAARLGLERLDRRGG